MDAASRWGSKKHLCPALTLLLRVSLQPCASHAKHSACQPRGLGHLNLSSTCWHREGDKGSMPCAPAVGAREPGWAVGSSGPARQCGQGLLPSQADAHWRWCSAPRQQLPFSLVSLRALYFLAPCIHDILICRQSNKIQK